MASTSKKGSKGPWVIIAIASVLLIISLFTWSGSSPPPPQVAATGPSVPPISTGLFSPPRTHTTGVGIPACTYAPYQYLPSRNKPSNRLDTLDMKGDHCVVFPKDGVMTIQPKSRTEILPVDFEELKVDLETYDGRPLTTITLKKAPDETCFPKGWGRAVLRPQGNTGGTVRVRVAQEEFGKTISCP